MKVEFYSRAENEEQFRQLGGFMSGNQIQLWSQIK
jgi:hypothetical protein